MKNLFSIFTFILASHSSIIFAQSGTCKYYLFTCPPSSGAVICKNDRKFKMIEDSGDGMSGIYTKNESGCWQVGVSQKKIRNKPTNYYLLKLLRKWYGNNALKPLK